MQAQERVTLPSAAGKAETPSWYDTNKRLPGHLGSLLKVRYTQRGICSLTCPYCRRSFDKMGKFKSHVDLIHTAKLHELFTVKCPLCDELFLNELSKARHSAKKHGTRSVSLSPATASRRASDPFSSKLGTATSCHRPANPFSEAVSSSHSHDIAVKSKAVIQKSTDILGMGRRSKSKPPPKRAALSPSAFVGNAALRCKANRRLLTQRKSQVSLLVAPNSFKLVIRGLTRDMAVARHRHGSSHLTTAGSSSRKRVLAEMQQSAAIGSDSLEVPIKRKRAKRKKTPLSTEPWGDSADFESDSSSGGHLRKRVLVSVPTADGGSRVLHSSEVLKCAMKCRREWKRKGLGQFEESSAALKRCSGVVPSIDWRTRCPLCSRKWVSFKRDAYVAKHIEARHLNPCSHCRMSFTTPINLAQHLGRHRADDGKAEKHTHNEAVRRKPSMRVLRAPDSSKATAPFTPWPLSTDSADDGSEAQCEFCGVRRGAYDSEWKFRTHLRAIHNWKCPHCELRFAHAPKVRTHESLKHPTKALLPAILLFDKRSIDKAKSGGGDGRKEDSSESVVVVIDNESDDAKREEDSEWHSAKQPLAIGSTDICMQTAFCSVSEKRNAAMRRFAEAYKSQASAPSMSSLVADIDEVLADDCGLSAEMERRLFGAETSGGSRVAPLLLEDALRHGMQLTADTSSLSAEDTVEDSDRSMAVIDGVLKKAPAFGSERVDALLDQWPATDGSKVGLCPVCLKTVTASDAKQKVDGAILQHVAECHPTTWKLWSRIPSALAVASRESVAARTGRRQRRRAEARKKEAVEESAVGEQKPASDKQASVGAQTPRNDRELEAAQFLASLSQTASRLKDVLKDKFVKIPTIPGVFPFADSEPVARESVAAETGDSEFVFVRDSTASVLLRGEAATGGLQPDDERCVRRVSALLSQVASGRLDDDLELPTDSGKLQAIVRVLCGELAAARSYVEVTDLLVRNLCGDIAGVRAENNKMMEYLYKWEQFGTLQMNKMMAELQKDAEHRAYVEKYHRNLRHRIGSGLSPESLPVLCQVFAHLGDFLTARKTRIAASSRLPPAAAMRRPLPPPPLRFQPTAPSPASATPPAAASDMGSAQTRRDEVFQNLRRTLDKSNLRGRKKQPCAKLVNAAAAALASASGMPAAIALQSVTGTGMPSSLPSATGMQSSSTRMPVTGMPVTGMPVIGMPAALSSASGMPAVLASATGMPPPLPPAIAQSALCGAGEGMQLMRALLGQSHVAQIRSELLACVQWLRLGIVPLYDSLSVRSPGFPSSVSQVMERLCNRQYASALFVFYDLKCVADVTHSGGLLTAVNARFGRVFGALRLWSNDRVLEWWFAQRLSVCGLRAVKGSKMTGTQLMQILANRKLFTDCFPQDTDRFPTFNLRLAQYKPPNVF